VDRPPAVFLSYARFDDQQDAGQISRLRERLEGEVRAATGVELTIFEDREDIRWWQEWQARVESALEAVTFLIPILTPAFFQSAACRRELETFLRREEALGRKDLVLPIYYVDVPAFNDLGERAADPLAAVLAARQWDDWRELRFKAWTPPLLHRRLAPLAAQIRDALRAEAARDIQKPPAVAELRHYLEDLAEEAGEGGQSGAVALPRAPRLLIEGPPGAGKTALLRFVACLLARDLLGIAGPDRTWRERPLGFSGNERCPVPVLLRLADLVPLWRVPGPPRRDDRRWLLDLLEQTSLARGWRVSREAWGRLLQSDGTVLLLDGLDEIADEGLRKRLFAVLHNAAKHWPCRLVVTSRPLQTGALREMGFEVAVVEPSGREGDAGGAG
jgi:hypothetical protein